MTKNKKYSTLDKIKIGINLTYEKLVQEKAKRNASLVFSENGKIIHVKAKKLLKEMETAAN